MAAAALLLMDGPALAATCPGHANQLCFYSQVDPAGSKGSQSLALGLGVSRLEAESADAQNPDEPGDNDTSQLLRVYLTKGLPFPVDFGLMLGTSPSGHFQQAGAHAQWTAFEGFKLPAVTLRTSFLKSSWVDMVDSRMEMASVDSKTVEVITSWGILGVLTPYAGLGVTEVGNEKTRTHCAGLEIQAMPPFMRVGVESRSAFAKRQFMAKISLGL